MRRREFGFPALAGRVEGDAKARDTMPFEGVEFCAEPQTSEGGKEWRLVDSSDWFRPPVPDGVVAFSLQF